MNNIEIKETTPEEVTEFFRRDPTLCYLGLPDEALAHLMTNPEYIIYKEDNLLGCYVNNSLVSVIKYELFTNQTINIHVYLCSYMFDSGAFQKIQEAFKQYLIKETDFIKVLVMCPKTCTHIQKSAEDYGFIKEGVISSCMVWRNELTDILIYGISIDRPSEE